MQGKLKRTLQHLIWVFMLIGASHLSGCADSVTIPGEQPDPICEPGDILRCSCGEGVVGAYICNEDGFLGACNCGPGFSQNPDDIASNGTTSPDRMPTPEQSTDTDPEPNPNPEPDPEPDPVKPEPEINPDPEPQERYCYSEVWHDGADLSQARATMSSDWQRAAQMAMEARWPGGAVLMRNDLSMLRQFGETGSWSSLMESMGVIIHEGTHIFDYGHANWEQNMAYYIHGDRTFITDWVHGFDRSEIRQDVVGDSTQIYRDLYLVGEQGARGWSELMDEQNCYIMDMASTAVVGDQIDSWGWSARDGALAFLYYMQLYLRRARMHYPNVYQRLQNDSEIQELVLLQWLRAHFWLEVSERYPEQGISDREIKQLLYDNANIGELKSFLGVAIEASPCLPVGVRPPWE